MSKNSTDEFIKEQISGNLEKIEKMLGDLDIPYTDQLEGEVQTLRTLLAEQRPPRLALVGRRGSGKSSLINAIFNERVADVGHEGAMTGEATWWPYSSEHGTIEVLDTRGLQEGSSPEKQVEEDTAIDSIRSALSDKPADAVLFLVKAKEVDSAIDSDIESLGNLTSWMEEKFGHQTPVLAVATHCDVVEPKKVELDDPDSFPREAVDEKEARIDRIRKDLERKLRTHERLNSDILNVVGVSSYVSWAEDGSMRFDDRWNIDEFTRYLVDDLPDQVRFELARLSQAKMLQRRIANRLVNACSVVSGAIGAAPTPVADIAPLTGLQVSLVLGIGYLSGRDFNTETALEFMGAMGVNTGAAFGFREAARALAQLVPVAGNAVSGAVAYGATYGLGKAAIKYFIGDADADEAKEVFEQASDEAEKDY